MNVLYIGDNKYWADVLTEALRGLADVTTAPNTEGVTGGQVDLIVLDALQIEQLGELVKRGYQHKVVVATAAPHWREAVKVLHEGALDYIPTQATNIPNLRQWFKEEILPILET